MRSFRSKFSKIFW